MQCGAQSVICAALERGRVEGRGIRNARTFTSERGDSVLVTKEVLYSSYDSHSARFQEAKRKL